MAITESSKRYRHKRVDRLKEWLNLQKAHPCADCGIDYPPYVMDYDHRNPWDKTKSVGALVASRATVAVIQSEIDKCDLVCSNCHRERTWGPGAIERLRNLSVSSGGTVTRGGKVAH